MKKIILHCLFTLLVLMPSAYAQQERTAQQAKQGVVSSSIQGLATFLEERVQDLDAFFDEVEALIENNETFRTNLAGSECTQSRHYARGVTTSGDLNCVEGPIRYATGPTSSYEWQTGNWSGCSETCGGGVQTRTVECVDTSTGLASSDSNCDGTRPDDERACNDQACPSVTWNNMSCGGEIATTYNCIAGEPAFMQCASTLMAQHQDTTTSVNCPGNQVGSYVQGRCVAHASCEDVVIACPSGSGELCIDDSNCNSGSSCVNNCCVEDQRTYGWQTGAWSDCDACGSREVYCEDDQGQRVDDMYCDANNKPEESLTCTPFMCPVDCKQGVEVRPHDNMPFPYDVSLIDHPECPCGAVTGGPYRNAIICEGVLPIGGGQSNPN